MAINQKQKYFALPISKVLRELKSSRKGLSQKEAKRRLRRDGPNKLPEFKADSLFAIFLRQFKSPFIYILLIASGLVFATGETMDGFIVISVLLLHAIIGTIQEGKARNILTALKKITKTQASVMRDGKEIIVSDEEVVAGDIVVLREGEKIPADARLLHSSSLKVDESSLTGESIPRHKTEDNNEKIQKSISEENRNAVFKGTNVVSGTGTAIVIATGRNTSIGSIAEKITEAEEELPLKNNIRYLSRIIMGAVGVSVLILAILGIWRGYSIQTIFLVAVSISVSIIPEGLPIVVTLILARGVWRMGERKVLVKKLQAIEALGQMKVMVLDKTGTLTRNELVVREVWTNNKVFEASGEGYDPKGEIFLDEKEVEPLNHQELLLAGKIAALCSSSHLAAKGHSKDWRVSGDPTEAAILVFSSKMGFKKEDLESEMPKLDEIPFSYELRYHATLHQDGKRKFLSVIGAPEDVLGLASQIWLNGKSEALDLKEKKILKSAFISMSKRGLRVLAFAFSHLKGESLEKSSINNLTFAGFFGIRDELRKNVEESVGLVRNAGIRLAMATGDNEITAKAIAEEAGIFQKWDGIMLGSELDKLSPKQIASRLNSVSIFARVTPFHKLKIIDAYKKRGEVVAMTGDGVNDALSLVSADVGVAMGKIGTEVAKEASDIVLLDDNFGSIVNGVEEGRNIYKNIKKVILYLFSTGVGELLTIFGALFLGMPLPILATQILWLNLVTDGFLDVALAMEPKEEKLLEKTFQSSKKWLIDRLMAVRIFTMSIPMAIGTLFLFNRLYQNDLSKAWTVSLTTLAVFQWFNAWNCRSEDKSIFRTNPFSNKFLIGATGIVMGLQLLAIYNPFFQKVLRTVPLNGKEWVVIIAVAFLIIIVEEFRKIIYRKFSA
ncbi:MAG: HAD-IC family P-type ATPase [Candidatus Moranbacteria bacterium]|nr:HAD-IC family P-type ATPase [Candidatus Moranbacteria bacterium]